MIDPASITLISLAAATLLWNVWQSYKHGHLLQSKCMLGYDNTTDNPLRDKK